MKKLKILCLISVLSLSSLFAQEEKKDYPLLSGMDGFNVSKYVYLKYARLSFVTPEGNQSVEGRYYQVDYALQKDAQSPGKLGILKNYEQAVSQLKGQLTASSDAGGNAYRHFKIIHKGQEIWVKVKIYPYREDKYTLSIIEKSPLIQEVSIKADYVPGSIPEPKYEEVADNNEASDHPLFSNRMKGFFIWEKNVADFEKFTFLVAKNEAYEIEGKKHVITYRLMPKAPYPGGLGILKNYQNAIEKIGGETLLFDQTSRSPIGIFKLIQGTVAIWIQVNVDNINRRYQLVILESKALEQQISADADYLAENIQNTGRVAVYGILFDTGKSIIKPESAEAISEIAKLLEQNPDLNIYIVGHTDMEGKLADNLALAEDRSKAVLDWLIEKHSINADRLTAKGVGPLSPLASNDSEAGKRLNRRVELVKK